MLLGASNLSLSLPLVLSNLPELAGGGADVLVAAGHGRSWNQWTRVWLRELPGIPDCGLWQKLAELNGSRPLPLSAVMTDVGNDLLYGLPVELILQRVEECADRLAKAGARITVTGLPVERVQRLSRWEFSIARRILFPGSGFRWDQLQRSVEALNEGLQQLANRDGIQFFPMPASWYGIDPIHIRRSARAEAWARILTGHPLAAEDEPAGGQSASPADRLVTSDGRPLLKTQPAAARKPFRRLLPEVRKYRGLLQQTPQPCFELPDLRVHRY